MTFEKYPQLIALTILLNWSFVQTLKSKTWKFHVFGAKYFFEFYNKYADDRNSLSGEEGSDIWKVSPTVSPNCTSKLFISSNLEK